MIGSEVRNGHVLSTPPSAFAAQPVSSHQWLNTWITWDAGWYTRLATEGYHDQQIGYAFSPLYPWLIGLPTWLVGHVFFVGWIISNLAMLGWILLLWHYSRLHNDATVADDAIIFLLLFPAAFIFSAVMTESLFLLLVIASLFAAEKKRWLIASICGALVAITRPIGIGLLLPLLILFGQQHGWRPWRWPKSFWWLALIPLALGGWILYQYQQTGDPLTFLHAQAAWRRHIGSPISQVITAVSADNAYDRTLGWSIVFLLGLLIGLWKKMTPAERAYSWTFTLIPLASGWFSFPRYTIVLFPIALGISRLHIPRWPKYILMLLMAIIQGWLFLHWPLHTSLVI